MSRSASFLIALLAIGCATTDSAPRSPSATTRSPSRGSAGVATVTSAVVDSAGVEGCALRLEAELPGVGSNASADFASIELLSGGRVLASAARTPVQRISAGGAARFTTRFRVHAADLYAKDKALRPGTVVPAVLEVELDVVENGRSRRFAATTKTEIPLPVAPRFELREARVDSGSLLLRTWCFNDNAFPLDGHRATSSLSVDGKSWGVVEAPLSLSAAPGERVVVDFRFEAPKAKAPIKDDREPRTLRFEGTLLMWSPYGELAFPVGATGTIPVAFGP